MDIKRSGSQPSARGPEDWFAPGERHWHGAAPNCAMCHVAIAEARDGKVVDWLEKVSDADYGGGAP